MISCELTEEVLELTVSAIRIARLQVFLQASNVTE
jgi:hypothetical protein